MDEIDDISLPFDKLVKIKNKIRSFSFTRVMKSDGQARKFRTIDEHLLWKNFCLSSSWPAICPPSIGLLTSRASAWTPGPWRCSARGQFCRASQFRAPAGRPGSGRSATSRLTAALQILEIYVFCIIQKFRFLNFRVF